MSHDSDKFSEGPIQVWADIVNRTDTKDRTIAVFTISLAGLAERRYYRVVVSRSRVKWVEISFDEAGEKVKREVESHWETMIFRDRSTVYTKHPDWYCPGPNPDCWDEEYCSREYESISKSIENYCEILEKKGFSQ